LQPIGRYIAKDVPEDILGVKRNKDQFVVHPGERLSPAMGGVAGHCGNLAQQCAIVKVAGMADLKSPDSARCFDGEEARFEVVKNKRHREGEVLVIRYEGPQRGPGMRVSSRPLSLPRWRTVRQVSRTHTSAGVHSSTARKVCHVES
jgi:dihydroxyacid dehydratase/phosphogluconate dehydratase